MEFKNFRLNCEGQVRAVFGAYIENLSSMHLSKWQLLYAKSLGILAPKGKMTFLWRLSFILGKSKARQHLLDIIEWQPKMIVMSHGELVTQNATEYLKESFKWLF